MHVEGGRVIRTRQAEAAFAVSLAVIKGTGANQVKLPTAANQAILGIADIKGDPLDAKYLNVPIVEQGEATIVSAAAFAAGDLLKVAGVTGKLGPIGDEVGGNVNVVARAMEAAAGADENVAALIEQFQLRDQIIANVRLGGALAATAANWGIFFTADQAMEVIECVERNEVVPSDGGGVTMMVTKVPSGTAKGSGVDMLASAINLKSTADTNVVGVLHGTAGNRQLADGDSVAIIPTGTLTALVGLSVRLTFRLL